MITEFTCGIYTASINECGGVKWFIKTNNTVIGIVEKDGIGLTLTKKIFLTNDCLIEISVLMNNIKRQHKQL